MIMTKVVATVGPASWDVPMLTKLAESGVDVFRINFSHGTAEDRQMCLDNIRAAQDNLGRPLAIMADLCGPKIRVGEIVGGGFLLAEGAELVIHRKPIKGTPKGISTTLAELIDDVRRGQRILIDDGKLAVKVVDRRPPNKVVCKVLTGGMISSGKGINLPQTRLSLSALTEKDRRDAAWIAKRDFDYVALSFVQRAADVQALRKILAKAGSEARIVAKIEKPQAIKNIDAIIKATDAVLVARGDLGVEMPLPDVPMMQKRLVSLCTRAGKPCIVATQMLESMTACPTPTRAEVSDVANAVLEGTDAVMLSGETAVGKYPREAVTMMNRIAQGVERQTGQIEGQIGLGRRFGDTPVGARAAGADDPTVAIARAVHTLVHNEKIRAVVAYTLTGQTGLLLAKMRLPVPILALTPDRRVLHQTCLYYGVQSAQIDIVEHTRDILDIASKHVRKLRWAKKGDKVVVVSGRPLGEPGATNTLVVHTL